MGADENSLSSRGGHALKANSYHVSISGIVTWPMVVSSMTFPPVELLGLRPWHLSTRFVERNPPTFVGRSRLRTAKAEAYPPFAKATEDTLWHSSTGLHPWISAKEGKLLFQVSPLAVELPRSRVQRHVEWSLIVVGAELSDV